VALLVARCVVLRQIVEFLSVLVRAVVYQSPALKGELQAELLRLDAVHKCLSLFFEVTINYQQDLTKDQTRV
jgi:hypothetical protein